MSIDSPFTSPRPVRRWPARALACALAAAGGLPVAAPALALDKAANEAGGGAAPLFSKSQWTVASASCPVGCADAMRDFLKAQVGHAVRLAPDRFDAPFLEPCAGTLRWAPSTSTFADVAAELAKSSLDGATLKASDLGVAPNATMHRAVAWCASGGVDVAFARLLSVEPDRILMLFEQQSLIELR